MVSSEQMQLYPVVEPPIKTSGWLPRPMTTKLLPLGRVLLSGDPHGGWDTNERLPRDASSSPCLELDMKLGRLSIINRDRENKVYVAPVPPRTQLDTSYRVVVNHAEKVLAPYDPSSGREPEAFVLRAGLRHRIALGPAPTRRFTDFGKGAPPEYVVVVSVPEGLPEAVHDPIDTLLEEIGADRDDQTRIGRLRTYLDTNPAARQFFTYQMHQFVVGAGRYPNPVRPSAADTKRALKLGETSQNKLYENLMKNYFTKGTDPQFLQKLVDTKSGRTATLDYLVQNALITLDDVADASKLMELRNLPPLF
jgi:hypothetical protein